MGHKPDIGLRPLYSRTVVEPLDESETESGLIIVDDREKRKVIRGLVLAVGEGYHEEDGKIRKLAVSVGDIVLFQKFCGDKVRVNGQEFMFLDEQHILGKWEEQSKP